MFQALCTQQVDILTEFEIEYGDGRNYDGRQTKSRAHVYMYHQHLWNTYSATLVKFGPDRYRLNESTFEALMFIFLV